MGKSGTGKSTLINNLLAAPIAIINDDRTGTINVDEYNINKYGHHFKIYDTPGLFDSTLTTEQVTKKIATIKKINIVLICHDISQPRLYNDDINIFKEIKKIYGPNIFKHSVLIFTKSNLVKNLPSRNKTRYNDINLNIPMINAYDTDNDIWIHKLWSELIKHSDKPDLLLEASYIKFALCDPMERIIKQVKKDNLYPRKTQENVNKEYINCLENKVHEKKGIMKDLKALMEDLKASIYEIIAGVMSVGKTLEDRMDDIIIGNAFGIASGLEFSQFKDIACKNQTEKKLKVIINSNHYDTYHYNNGKVAFEGMFYNNLPHGNGIVYDEKSDILWSGNFNKGIAQICQDVIF